MQLSNCLPSMVDLALASLSPPESMLQNAREARTSGVANEFGYHISWVNLLLVNISLFPFSSFSDHISLIFQAISTFYSTFHIAQEGIDSWPHSATLEKANNDLKELRVERNDALA